MATRSATSPAEQARIAAGYGGDAGLKRMAKRLRRCPAYCRKLELHGGAPYNYAHDAAGLLGCDWDVFYPRQNKTRAEGGQAEAE